MRYEQGNPSEGYSDQEVLKRYGEVSHAVPPDQYAQAAQEALGKLSPEDRAEFLKMLQERAAARGVKLPGNVASDPKDLGKVLTDLHEKPGQLRDILGGGQPQGQAPGSNPIIDILKSPQAKAVLAGIAARWSSASRRVRPERRSAVPMSGILLEQPSLISSRGMETRRRYDIAPKRHSSGWCGGPLSSVVR